MGLTVAALAVAILAGVRPLDYTSLTCDTTSMINSHDMPNATTGRHIITFRSGTKPETMTRLLSKTAGIRAVLTSDGATAADMGPDFGFGTAGLVFDTIGSAVVEADDD